MSEDASPSGPSIGNRILDVTLGVGAMLLLIPIAPFLLLLWLWDRFKNDEPEAGN